MKCQLVLGIKNQTKNNLDSTILLNVNDNQVREHFRYQFKDSKTWKQRRGEGKSGDALDALYQTTTYRNTLHQTGASPQTTVTTKLYNSGALRLRLHPHD